MLTVRPLLSRRLYLAMSSELTDAFNAYDAGHLPINSPYRNLIISTTAANAAPTERNNGMNNTMFNDSAEARAARKAAMTTNNTLNDTVNATFAAPTGAPVDAAKAGVKQVTVLTGGMRRKEIGKLDLPVTDCHQALALGGLDFEVGFRSLYDISQGTLDSPQAHRTGHVLRLDTNVPLGRSVTTGYSVQQNGVLAEVGNHVVRSFGGQVDNVIAKGDGEDVGLTITLPNDTYIGNGRKLISKLTLLKGHGGVRNITIVAHDVDLFCTNQIVSMLKNGETIATIAHTASANLKLSMVHDKVMQVLKHQDEWNQAIIDLSLQSARITPMLDRLYGSAPNTTDCQTARAANGVISRWESNRDRILTEYRKPFNADLNGTALGVLWAVQGAEEHTDGRGNLRTEQSKIGRFISQTQPLAEKAYAFLTT